MQYWHKLFFYIKRFPELPSEIDMFRGIVVIYGLSYLRRRTERAAEDELLVLTLGCFTLVVFFFLVDLVALLFPRAERDSFTSARCRRGFQSRWPLPRLLHALRLRPGALRV